MNTTKQAVSKATVKLAKDMSNLATRRDGALSAFRQARSDLEAVSAETQTALNDFASLMDFINIQVAAGEKMISDNAHVCAKITEIIGE